MEPKIERFFLQLPDDKRAIAMVLRDIMLHAHPGIKEAIKWNQLTFFYGKTNLAFIYSFPDKDYINVGFFDAVSLMDPKKLFEGTGNRMRHIKVRTEKDIPATQLKKWMKEAVAIIND